MSTDHHEQSYPSSCVPACMAMIQRWRGEPPTEETFHDGADRAGHPLDLVLTLSRTRRLPATITGDDAEIHLALRQVRRVVVMVSGPPYARWQQERYPLATSRHGVLCAPGSHGAPFHAVLLIARSADGYTLYDPWFPSAQQPFEISEDAFQTCFAGLAIPASP